MSEAEEAEDPETPEEAATPDEDEPAAAPAVAAQCNHKGGFKSFIADFKKEAAS